MGKRALALFDFDGTLIRGDSIVSFLCFALSHRVMKRREFASACLYGALAAMRLVSTVRAKEKALAFLYRMPSERADALCGQFAIQILLPALYPRGLDTLRRHAAAGDIVLLVTASPERYMRSLTAALPVSGLIATASGPDGTILKNCRGENKVTRILQWLDSQDIQPDLAASHAYGNSTGDLPMLHMAGHPFLVNPTRALRRRAHGTAVLSWGQDCEKRK